MGFIYKITNLITHKCYIGETKQEYPELRWKEHIKSINKNKGCPALISTIKKHGIVNFKFEVLIICFDEDRFEYEKEYIKKYNSQVPNGYNILPGGIGGAGFLGKKHTKESIKKILDAGKRFREENPNHYDTYREKLKESMKNVDISSAVKYSDKFRKAVQEGRIGGKAHKESKHSEETKNKIRNSIIKYYEEIKENKDLYKINIEKHREVMAKAVGKRIAQFTKDNVFIKEYISIREADRLSGIKKSNIQHVLLGNNKTAGGYIWKYADNTDLKT
jgi:group I intron endonuclease